LFSELIYIGPAYLLLFEIKVDILQFKTGKGFIIEWEQAS